MNNENNHQALLRDIFQLQYEDGRGEQLTHDRIRQVIKSGEDYTPAELSIIATSPLARDRIYSVRQGLWKTTIEQNSLPTTFPVQVAAAAKAQEEEIIRLNDQAILRIFKGYPEVGIPWMIQLELDETYYKDASSGETMNIPIALIDKSGNTWVEGIPDEEGKIQSNWDSEESPIDIIVRENLDIIAK